MLVPEEPVGQESAGCTRVSLEVRCVFKSHVDFPPAIGQVWRSLRRLMNDAVGTAAFDADGTLVSGCTNPTPPPREGTEDFGTS